MADGVFSLWTIYDHPRDYPNSYVARRFENDRPTADHMVSPDIESLREQMRQRGLALLSRDQADDPSIVETWL